MNDRLIRGGIIDSERVNSLSWAAECFYRRLQSLVDDYGNYDGRIDVLRADAYKLKLNQVSTADVSSWLQLCEHAGLIRCYEVENKSYIHLLDFGQKLKRFKRKFPASPDEPPEEKRREGELEIEKEENIPAQAREHPLQIFVKKFKNVSKIKDQLTFEECERLCAEFPKQKIADVLEAMENKKDLTKKYVSVNLTLRNWLKMDFKKEVTPGPKIIPIEKQFTQKTLDKYIGATVMPHAVKKNAVVEGITGDKLIVRFADGSKGEYTMKEVLVTASAPRRNMAEASIGQILSKQFQK